MMHVADTVHYILGPPTYDAADGGNGDAQPLPPLMMQEWLSGSASALESRGLFRRRTLGSSPKSRWRSVRS